MKPDEAKWCQMKPNEARWSQLKPNEANQIRGKHNVLYVIHVVVKKSFRYRQKEDYLLAKVKMINFDWQKKIYSLKLIEWQKINFYSQKKTCTDRKNSSQYKIDISNVTRALLYIRMAISNIFIASVKPMAYYYSNTYGWSVHCLVDYSSPFPFLIWMLRIQTHFQQMLSFETLVEIELNMQLPVDIPQIHVAQEQITIITCSDDLKRSFAYNEFGGSVKTVS